MNASSIPPSEALPRRAVSGAQGVSRDGTGGDQEWLSELVRGHTRRVFALLYRMTGNAGDAQDLSQEVFLKAWTSRHQLRDAARPTPWLLRIAANCAIDFQRSRASQRPGSAKSPSLDIEGDPSGLRDRLASDDPGPEALSLRDERQRRLWAALEVLSPKERAAVVMRDIEGCPNRDVARALGCSMITVRTHIASARIKLRKFLRKTDKAK